MDRLRRSARNVTSDDQKTSKEPAVQVDLEKLSLRYPLRNRLRQSQLNVGKQLSSEVTKPLYSSARATSSITASKYLPTAARSEPQLRCLPSDDEYKGGTFDLTEALESNHCIKSSRSVQADNECSIHNLPAEVLTMIFSYMTVKELSVNVAPVCKYWYTLAHSPVLWRTLTFKGQHVPLSEVKRLLRKSYLLSSLCIKDRYDVGKIISQICQSNKNIRSLAIHRVGDTKTPSYSWKTILAKHLHQLLRRCPGITKLILKDVTIRSRKFYQQLGSSLPNLTFLGLSHSHLLNPSHISAVADNCRRLKVLWLSGDCQCGQSLHWEDAFQKLFRNLSGTLTHLQFDASKLSDPAFEDLSHCKELRVLILHKAIHISTIAIDSISSLKKLEYLNVHKSQYDGGEEHPYPFESATFNLVYLSLPESIFVNDRFAEVVANYCPHLRGISLAFSSQVSDLGIVFIIKGCKQLHYLDIYSTSAVRGYCFVMFSSCAPQLNLVLVEASCESEREFHIKWLIDNHPYLNVERAKKWLAGRKKCSAELKKHYFM